MRFTLLAIMATLAAVPAHARCMRDPYTGEPDRNCIYRERQEQYPQYQPAQPHTVCQFYGSIAPHRVCHTEF